MLPFVYSFVTYKDVFGRDPPNIEEVAAYFASLHTGHLIQALCKLNIALWKGRTNKDTTIGFALHNDIMKLYFTEDELKQIYKCRLKNKKMKPFVFHRQQILIAIKLALLNNNVGGVVDINLQSLGKYILAINDFLDSNNQPPPYIDLLKSVHFEYTRSAIAKLGYFHNTSNFFYAFTRALYMWLDLPFTDRGIRMLEQFKIDIHDEFFNAVGLTVEEYLGFSVLYSLPLFNLDPRTQNPKDYMLFWDYLKNTKLTDNKKKTIFKLLSQNIEDYPYNHLSAIHTKLSDVEYFENNFLPLIENPIININENMAVVADPLYLIQKITQGVYWILHNKYKNENNKIKLSALSNYYGTLHQEYTYQTLLSLCDKVIEIPTKQGEKRADFAGIINDADGVYLLIVEAKKIALPLPMVFESEKEQTIKKLKQVFLDDGFRQVFNTVSKIQQGQFKELGLEYIENKNIKIVFPLLALDSYVVEESLNRKLYEDEFFSKLFEEIPILGNIPISHPMFFCADDLETIETINNSREKERLLSFINILIFRNSQLNKRHNIVQTQFIPHMYLKGIDDVTDELDTLGNTLYLLKPDGSKNTRLQDINKRHIEAIKKILF